MISVVVLFIAAFNLDMCSQCCTAYQCSHFIRSSSCSDGAVDDARCFWDVGTGSCRNETCSDLPQSTCEVYHGSSCKWNGEACVEASSCSDWNGVSSCDSKGYNSIACITDESSGNCRAKTCADIGQSLAYCEASGTGLACVWDASGSCIPAASCSAWSSTENIGRCAGKYFGQCTDYNNVCQPYSCAIFSETDCETKGCEFSGRSCIEISSCSFYGQADCNNHGHNHTDCVWENNECRYAKCSDFNSDENTCRFATFDHVPYCKWENNDCVHADSMCEMNGLSNCEDYAYCVYLEGSCPSAPGDAASGVFVPAAVVMLVTLLALLLW